MLGQRYTLPPMPSALQAAACPAHHQACLDEGAKEGGGAGEGRPEQKVRTGREFKEMFLHKAACRLPSMGVSRPRLGRSGTWEPEVGIQAGWREPTVAAWESWQQDR